MKHILFILIICSSQISFGQNSDSLRYVENYNRYLQCIAKADSLFANQNWNDANSNYIEALRFVPNDQYSNKQIHACRGFLQKAEIERKYSICIRKADSLFVEQNWQNALIEYRTASAIDYDEPYPKIRIKQIENQIAEEQKQMALQKQYEAVIAKGNFAFNQNNFAQAYIAYDEARKLRPNEYYPNMRFISCDSLLTIQQDSTTMSFYYSFTDNGDSCFNHRNYNCAKGYYNAARNIFPNHRFAVNRLNEIKEIEIYAEFKQYILLGDSCANISEFNEAMNYYKHANYLRPGDTTVFRKINNVVSITTELLALDIYRAEMNFEKGIISADSLLAMYKMGLEIDPGNPQIKVLAEILQFKMKIGFYECDCAKLKSQSTIIYETYPSFNLSEYREYGDSLGIKQCGYFSDEGLFLGYCGKIIQLPMSNPENQIIGIFNSIRIYNMCR